MSPFLFPFLPPFLTAEPSIKWREGDIAGSVLDFDAGTISFFRNGSLIGNGSTFDGVESERALFPTAALGSFQRLSLNFGQAPFKVCPLFFVFISLLILSP